MNLSVRFCVQNDAAGKIRLKNWKIDKNHKISYFESELHVFSFRNDRRGQNVDVLLLTVKFDWGGLWRNRTIISSKIIRKTTDIASFSLISGHLAVAFERGQSRLASAVILAWIRIARIQRILHQTPERNTDWNSNIQEFIERWWINADSVFRGNNCMRIYQLMNKNRSYL